MFFLIFCYKNLSYFKNVLSQSNFYCLRKVYLIPICSEIPFALEKWVDSLVSVERHSERALVLKMVLGDCLLNAECGWRW